MSTITVAFIDETTSETIATVEMLVGNHCTRRPEFSRGFDTAVEL
jgi:hypothetical protein